MNWSRLTSRLTQWCDRHQIPLYLLAILLGALIGLAAPSVAPAAEVAINPVLIALLYATFLGIPLTRLGGAVRDIRFFGAVMSLNFLVVPVVVFGLSRFIAHDQALLVGVLLVLLAPCIDYVIVFAGLAGGDHARLLAAAPLLMLVQILLIPLYMSLMVGSEVFQVIELRAFGEAFLLLIVVPLLLAALTQFLNLTRIMALSEAFMVPLMMLALAVVVASQIDAVSHQLGQLLHVIPLYVAFLAIMVPLGMSMAKLFRQRVPAARAVVFSGATRNSLVVLPLSLALPPGLELVAVVVVTQTLVELIGMVIFVRLIPRLVKDPWEGRAELSDQRG